MGYWEERQEAMYKAGEMQVNKYFTRLEKAFNQTRRELQKTIDAFCFRYAEENGLSFAAAQKKLDAEELGELQDFIDLAMKNIGKYNQQVNNMSIKAQITRYQALEAQVDAILRQLYAIDYEAEAEKTMQEVYGDTYYRTWYNADQYHGFHAEFAQVSPTVVEKLLEYPFNGAAFSDRLWKQKDHLQAQLMEAATTMLIQGRHPSTLTKEFAKKMNSKKFDAYRLLHTESSFLMSEAAHAGYKEDSVPKYEILATLDSKTCNVCGDLDNKVYEVGKEVTGVNMPPFHPLCRCTTVPHYDDTPTEGLTRAARDPETGKTYEVPADMTWKEWKKKYVDKQEESQKRYADRREERKQRHSQGWRRQFMRNGSAEPEKTWREKYNETVEKEAVLKERLDQLNQESRKWEEKYFETMEEEYAQKSLSNDPEIEDITKQLDKIQEEKKTYVKIRLTEAEKSMAEAGIAETVKLSEKMTVESIDILENSLREMVVDNRLPSLKGVRYDPSFINLYGGKDTVALYNWGDETMYIGEMLSDPDAYKQHRLLAERSYKKQHNEYEPTWKNTIDSLEKEIYEEDDSGRKKYLTKNRNDVLSGLISQRRLVAEDAKDAIIHEYGHHVHNKASSESNIFGSKELKSRKFAGSYEWGGVHEGKVTAAQVSDYAAESPLEAFAESFTAYVKGEDIPESLKSMVEGAIEKTGGKLKQPVVKVPDSGIIKLTDADQYVLNQYVSFDFYPINEKLRNGTPLTERENNMAEQLDSALQKLPLYRGNLSRSLYFGGDGDAIKECLNKFPVGEEICFKEFLSTACGAELYNPDGEIQIFIENSRKGRDITNINSMEMEVLYERKSKFKVINVTEKAKKHWILLREG